MALEVLQNQEFTCGPKEPTPTVRASHIRNHILAWEPRQVVKRMVYADSV